jgi:hypothetical protein
MDNLIPIGTGLIIIFGLIFSGMKEGFSSEPLIASIGSMPKNKVPPNSGLPLFLNFYPRFGSDFKLFDLIQKLKLNNIVPMWNGIYKKGSNSRNLSESKKLPPIIIIPGLGASPLFARWNKTSSGTVQTADDDFQKADAWSCKQTQESWVQIWPPNVDGLASTCWANNTKVMANEGKIVNE